MNERDRGLCMFPDLQNNSNDFSVVDWLSMVTSVELGCYRSVNMRKL